MSAAVLIGLLGVLAAMHAAESGQKLDLLTVLGALLSLGVVGGFVAFYLREQRLHPDLDPSDDDDARDLMGGTIFKYGCLLFAVATAATAFVGLMQLLLIDRR